MSTPVKLAVKQQTQLRKLPHGSRIYAYNNILTNQVIYSLDRVLDNTTVLKQLPFAGKKTVPRALRKDHWKPFFVVKFGLPHQGLNTYKKLREWRKLHELSWDPKDVPKLQHSYQQKRARTKRKEEIQELGGARSGGARSRLTEWKMRRKMVIMNQKANSVADLAAVLIEQEAKFASWSPEREKLLTDAMDWVPKLVTEGKYRKARLASINEEIKALEQKIKDAKTTTGKKWALPLASKITNLSRDLRIKKTEYYQISHLPELFDVSRFAQRAMWNKNILFEALCEKEFLVRWQYTRLERELQRYQEASQLGIEDATKIEEQLSAAHQQLYTKANEVRELAKVRRPRSSGEKAINIHRKKLRLALQGVHELRNKITFLRTQLVRTGAPPSWLKREIFKNRVYDSLRTLFRIKPKLYTAAPLQRSEIANLIDATFEAPSVIPAVEADFEKNLLEGAEGGPNAGESKISEADETTTSESMPLTSEEAESVSLAMPILSAREERENAKQMAIEMMRKIKREEDEKYSRPEGHDQRIQLALKLNNYGNYKLSTTWLTMFPNFVSRFLTVMTSIVPKLTKEVSMSDVKVEWSDPLDAEYGREWPVDVKHSPMGFVRNTARSEKHVKVVKPINDGFKYNADGKLFEINADSSPRLIPKLYARATSARARVLVRSAERDMQRRQRLFLRKQRILFDTRARLERLANRHPRGPVGRALKRQAKVDLAMLGKGAPLQWTNPEPTKELKDARALIDWQKKTKAAIPPRKLMWSRRKGIGHYGLSNLGPVRVRPPAREKVEKVESAAASVVEGSDAGAEKQVES